MKWLALPAALGTSIVDRFGIHRVGTVVAVLICAGLVLAFGAMAEEVMEGDTHKADMAVLMAFRTVEDPSRLIGPPWFQEMVRDLTALGSYAFIILTVACALGYLLLMGKRAMAALMVAAVAGGMAISTLLKQGFDRPRPDIEHGVQVFTPSFPSGHATLSAVTFLTLGVLLSRISPHWRVRIYFVAVAVVLTFIVGASRVYLGVHYPSDVIAGWCIGTAWALLCWAGALWLQSRGQVESAGSKPD